MEFEIGVIPFQLFILVLKNEFPGFICWVIYFKDHSCPPLLSPFPGFVLKKMLTRYNESAFSQYFPDFYFASELIQEAIFAASDLVTCGIGAIGVAKSGQFSGFGL